MNSKQWTWPFTQEQVRLSHTARLANVKTAQASSACMNTAICIRSTVHVNIGLRVSCDVTCEYVSYGSRLS